MIALDAEQVDALFERRVPEGVRYTQGNDSTMEACRFPSRWQYVCHGDTRGYRARVAEVLLKQGRERMAERFALCGRGDRLVRSGSGTFAVWPRRCGVRMCPRCARWRGMGFVRRAFAYMQDRELQSLWHVVLTQRTDSRDSLVEARERMASKWRALRAPKVIGVQGGLLCEHVKWSKRTEAWHVHYHLFVEASRVDRLTSRWIDVTLGAEGETCCEPFVREICGPGVNVKEEKVEQLELWKESDDAVVRGIQYLVRDISEGPQIAELQHVSDFRLEEWVADNFGGKCHRFFGTWRSPEVEAQVAEEEAHEEEEEREGPGAQSFEVGTMDWILAGYGGSVAEAGLKALLEVAGGNQAGYCRRLRGEVRQALGMPSDG